MMRAFSRRGLAAALVLLSAATGEWAAAQSQAAPEAASGFAPKPLVRAATQMVVAAHPLAAEAGRAVLRAGGSAVDAAIAVQLALTVVEPQSSGIGGGGFALHWTAGSKTLEAWDGRETAPAAATREMFLDAEGAPLSFFNAATSGLAIGAPGTPRLLQALHARHGKLPWPRLFQDAIRLAEEGFPVSPRLHASLRFMARRLLADDAAAGLFFTADGAPLPVGATLRQPALAESLRRLADGGAEAFYTGPIAEAVAAAAAAEPRPGTLSPEDLAGYRVVERTPLCGWFRGRYAVCGMPPPSSGGAVVAQILGLMDHLPPQARGVERAHFFLEASRLAYADRNRYLADPDFEPLPIEGLLEQGYLTARAQTIRPRRATTGLAEPGWPRWPAPRPTVSDPEDAGPGTTHMTIVDAAGNILAMTSSIEVAFGSGRMAAGFFLNSQLTDFARAPREDAGGAPVWPANAPAPGKRPRSSMAPTIVFDRAEDGRPILALGSPGGSRIIEYVALALSGLLDEGLDPAEAASRPHLSQRNRFAAGVERRADADPLAAALAAQGHQVERVKTVSGLHIIQLTPDGALLGGADPRREGVALGD